MAFNERARLDPSQVEDRRGRGFGGGTVAIGGGGLGLLVVLVALLLGVDPFGDGTIPSTVPQPSTSRQAEQAAPTIEECQTGADANRRADCRIVGFVDSIQAYWGEEFGRRGQRYEPATTVLFSGATRAGCGSATTAQGPFYCPADGKVYLDLEFFNELRQRFGAQGGPFAEGYVVAHEYGHHVQHLLGLLPAGGAGDTGPRSGSVQTELQADCLAGVWAQRAASTGYLQAPSDADIAAAMDAAAAVGDDRIQQQATGEVNPEEWTHGSAEQRQQHFLTGFNSGTTEACRAS